MTLLNLTEAFLFSFFPSYIIHRKKILLKTYPNIFIISMLFAQSGITSLLWKSAILFLRPRWHGIPSPKSSWLSHLSSKSESLASQCSQHFFLAVLFTFQEYILLYVLYLSYFSSFTLKSPVLLRNKIKELSNGLKYEFIVLNHFTTNIPW